jgi:transglutaminase superfamily protein
MQSPSNWLVHTSMTQPAGLEPLFKNLPADVTVLNRVVQGLLVHCAWLESYGTDLSAFGPISRTTLPVSERLTAMVERDGLSLDEARAPTQRAVGTCRDFALTLCALLRTIGTPARLRCGFASYFGDGWEDHWVCEYWNSQRGRWCLSDPQIDQVMHAACGITFNTADIPCDVFLTAGEAWLQCRAGKSNPNQFGHEDTKGLWFMKVNVVRDSHAVNNRETSAWDRWREAPVELRTVLTDELPELDRLARNPEEPAAEFIPPWLAIKHSSTATFKRLP